MIVLRFMKEEPNLHKNPETWQYLVKNRVLSSVDTEKTVTQL